MHMLSEGIRRGAGGCVRRVDAVDRDLVSVLSMGCWCEGEAKGLVAELPVVEN